MGAALSSNFSLEQSKRFTEGEAPIRASDTHKAPRRDGANFIDRRMLSVPYGLQPRDAHVRHPSLNRTARGRCHVLLSAEEGKSHERPTETHDAMPTASHQTRASSIKPIFVGETGNKQQTSESPTERQPRRSGS